MEELLTTADVARRYGVSLTTAEKWCRRGYLDCVALGNGRNKRWIIPAVELDDFERPKNGRPRKRSD